MRQGFIFKIGDVLPSIVTLKFTVDGADIFAELTWIPVLLVLTLVVISQSKMHKNSIYSNRNKILVTFCFVSLKMSKGRPCKLPTLACRYAYFTYVYVNQL